jgi:hypothetical protein
MVRRNMKRKSIAVVLVLALALMACNAATIEAYINLAVQIALQVAQLAGLSVQAASQVTADMALVTKLINDYKAAPASDKTSAAGKVNEALNVAEQDLQALLAACHITPGSKLGTTITASIAIAITAVESIRTIALGNQPAPVATAAARTARVVLPGGVVPKSKAVSPAQLKALYNKTVAAYPQAGIK